MHYQIKCVFQNNMYIVFLNLREISPVVPGYVSFRMSRVESLVNANQCWVCGINNTFQAHITIIRWESVLHTCRNIRWQCGAVDIYGYLLDVGYSF